MDVGVGAGITLPLLYTALSRVRKLDHFRLWHADVKHLAKLGHDKRVRAWFAAVGSGPGAQFNEELLLAHKARVEAEEEGAGDKPASGQSTRRITKLPKPRSSTAARTQADGGAVDPAKAVPLGCKPRGRDPWVEVPPLPALWSRPLDRPADRVLAPIIAAALKRPHPDSAFAADALGFAYFKWLAWSFRVDFESRKVEAALVQQRLIVKGQGLGHLDKVAQLALLLPASPRTSTRFCEWDRGVGRPPVTPRAYLEDVLRIGPSTLPAYVYKSLAAWMAAAGAAAPPPWVTLGWHQCGAIAPGELPLPSVGSVVPGVRVQRVQRSAPDRGARGPAGVVPPPQAAAAAREGAGVQGQAVPVDRIAHPFVGWANLGSTCYMAATLVALVHQPGVQERTVADVACGATHPAQHADGCARVGNCACPRPCPPWGSVARGRLRDIIAACAASRGAVGDLRPFVEWLLSLGNRFVLGRQEDAHEFLTGILSACCFLAPLVSCTFSQRIKCRACRNASVFTEDGTVLSIGLPAPRAVPFELLELLQGEFRAANLVGDNQYDCNTCRAKV